MDANEALLQKYFDGEASEEEQVKAKAILGDSPTLGADFEERLKLGSMLREQFTQKAEAVDFDTMWTGINRDIQWYEAGRERALAASAEQVGVKDSDEGWRETLARFFGWRTLTGLAAAALVLLMVPDLQSLFEPVVDVARVGPVGKTDVVADASVALYEGIQVESIEASDGASVMVLQGGDGASTIIWVNEVDFGAEEQAI